MKGIKQAIGGLVSSKPAIKPYVPPEQKVITTANALLVDTPKPKLGGKSFCVEASGIYVLSKVPGILRCIAVTHTGSGHTCIWDDSVEDNKPGRALFRMSPNVMGHFMLDAGFDKGLVIEASGNPAAFLTLVWVDQ